MIKNFDQLGSVLEQIQLSMPLVHHITNYVTVADCANITLAFGGSPVMADDLNEVEEIVSHASSLVLNIGTLNERRIESMVLAGKRANKLAIPIVLDPVGVGATKFRQEAVERLLNEVKVTVLKGNMSEIKHIYGLNSKTRGVDSGDHSLDGGIEIAHSLAKRLDCTVVITGAVDIVSNGEKTYVIYNGHELLSKVTGTGCMTSSLIGVCLGAGADPLYGAITGVMVMGISGELANVRLSLNDGLGSFKVYLMDAISHYSASDLEERGRIDDIR